MAELSLTLTPDEQAFLVNLLETKLKDMRVEEHRTRTPSYREGILRQEEWLVAILNKLGKPPA